MLAGSSWITRLGAQAGAGSPGVHQRGRERRVAGVVRRRRARQPPAPAVGAATCAILAWPSRVPSSACRFLPGHRSSKRVAPCCAGALRWDPGRLVATSGSKAPKAAAPRTGGGAKASTRPAVGRRPRSSARSSARFLREVVLPAGCQPGAEPAPVIARVKAAPRRKVAARPRTKPGPRRPPPPPSSTRPSRPAGQLALGPGGEARHPRGPPPSPGATASTGFRRGHRPRPLYAWWEVTTAPFRADSPLCSLVSWDWLIVGRSGVCLRS